VAVGPDEAEVVAASSRAAAIRQLQNCRARVVRVSWDIAQHQDLACCRMGDVLRTYGARVVGSTEKGRATCRVHDGDGLNVSYGAGFITCHSGCGGKTWDALGFVAEMEGLDLRVRDDLGAAAHRLASILGVRLEEDEGARLHPRRPQEARPAPAGATLREACTSSSRVALVEHALVKAARRLARAHGLSDVAGLLGGASNRAAQMAWEEDQR
jgi:hypothetical protein